MSAAAKFSSRRAYRSVFLSDFHLGARACRPGPILDFLRDLETEHLYLVGDILDTFHGGRVVWGPEHDAIVTELERMAADGTRVVYLPGNHDAPMRSPDATSPFAGVEVREALIHTGADGRRHLVLHGDQCDSRVMRWHFLTRLGSRTDAAMRRLDAALKQQFGEPRRDHSVIEQIIAGTSALLTFGERYEHRLTAFAAAAGASGVICGHSHKAALRDVDGIAYANCGDWIDSRTAMVEYHDGRFALLATAEAPALRPIATPVPGPFTALEPAPIAERRA